MMYRKTTFVLLIIAVSTRSLAVKTAEVTLNENTLVVNNYVELSINNRHTLAIDKCEATKFTWQVSQWLIENSENN